jgi:hypothetical protein
MDFDIIDWAGKSKTGCVGGYSKNLDSGQACAGFIFDFAYGSLL